jgi:uncharacterized protein
MSTCTAFHGHQRMAQGSLPEVTTAVQRAAEGGSVEGLLVYDDATGRLVDVDPRPIPPAEFEEPRGPGRPRLGVIAREVTLLPRHWDWLANQPGGASVALRKLVEEARRNSGDKDRRRAAQEAAYRFMSSMAGDFPGFEEALRALFAHDRRKFSEMVAPWPADVRDYAIKLAFADIDPELTPR